jgi:putative hemolysin
MDLSPRQENPVMHRSSAGLVAFTFATLALLVGCAGKTAPSPNEAHGAPSHVASADGTTAKGSDESTTSPSPAPSAGPSIGNPAAAYCTNLGYDLEQNAEDAQCKFPDGSSCEKWAFFRGECGGAFSFCALHGGKVRNQVDDMGGWTASYAVCDMPEGTSCKETSFVATNACTKE